MAWEKETVQRPSGLGILKLKCGQCGFKKEIAADAPLERTKAFCRSCSPMRRMEEVEFEVYEMVPPGFDTDEYIKEHDLNPRPKYNIPPKPWQMVVS